MRKSKGRKTVKQTKDKYGLRLVHADVTLRSKSGKSIHDKDARINSKTVHEYFPPEGFARQAEEILSSMGLRIIAKDKITLSVAAPMEKFEKIFNIKLKMKRFFPYAFPPDQKTPDRKGCGVYFEYRKKKLLPVPEQLRGLVDAIHLATPAIFCQDPNPPDPNYFHLKVPADVARIVDAIQCHSRGIDGTGVRLAMPDQGTFNHPYYTARGYNITLDETAYDDTADTGSHGTAIAANALAVAPGVEFIGIRNGKKISSATAAFSKAVEHNPDVISISWGTTGDVPNLRASIALAVADGITICCACGNGGTTVFPSSISEVISVGGTYANDTDELEASTYASSGILAAVDPGRQMPDLTGFVGQSPKGIYITLPVHSNSDEDQYFAGGAFPDGDETTDSDGWVVASGTSSATPQVAGVVCLMMQANPALQGNPTLIKQRLMETALDVTTGNSANGEVAGNGQDNATGTGVVDAFIAVNRIDVWIRDNINDRGLVPSKGAHWASPDIKVLTGPLGNPESDFNAAAHVDNPVYETPYYVYIKARNRGVDPANNVTVSFYYADPSTFNTYPDDWKDGQSGNPAQGSVTVDGLPTNQFLIDSIPAKGERVAGPFVWMPPLPTSATQVQTGDDGKLRGHFCLLTRIDCVSDPIIWPGGAQSTVWLDNNIGMKNLWVVESDVVFPLMLGLSKAKRTHLLIDTCDLPKGYTMCLRIPRKTVKLEALKSYNFIQSETQKGIVYIDIPWGRKNILDIASKERIPLKYWVTSRDKVGNKKKRFATIDIYHYADNKCISGASVTLDMLAKKRRKKIIDILEE